MVHGCLNGGRIRMIHRGETGWIHPPSQQCCSQSTSLREGRGGSETGEGLLPTDTSRLGAEDIMLCP